MVFCCHHSRSAPDGGSEEEEEDDGDIILENDCLASPDLQQVLRSSSANPGGPASSQPCRSTTQSSLSPSSVPQSFSSSSIVTLGHNGNLAATSGSQSNTMTL